VGWPPPLWDVGVWRSSITMIPYSDHHFEEGIHPQGYPSPVGGTRQNLEPGPYIERESEIADSE